MNSNQITKLTGLIRLLETPKQIAGALALIEDLPLDDQKELRLEVIIKLEKMSQPHPIGQ